MFTICIPRGFLVSGVVACVVALGFLPTAARAHERFSSVDQQHFVQQVDAQAVQKLIQQLQDPDEIVRLRAAKELGKLGAAAAPAIPALQNAAKDSDEDVRRVAVNSLKAIQAAQTAGPSEQVARLIRDLQNPDEFVRMKAAKELGKIGSGARDALPALQKLLQDPDEDVRLVATNSIRLIQASGAPSANVQKLIQQLEAADELVRMKAAKELAKLGSAAKDAVPALQKLLRDPDEDVRRVAANAIERIQGGGAPLPPTASVAGTTWVGTESLSGFGKLEFQFEPDGKAVMVDAVARVNGRWSQTGNQVTISFQNCVYVGTIQGQVLAGNARYTAGEPRDWTFSLNRQAAPAPQEQTRTPMTSAGVKPWPEHKFPPVAPYPSRR